MRQGMYLASKGSWSDAYRCWLEVKELSGCVYDGTSTHFEYRNVGQVSCLALFRILTTRLLLSKELCDVESLKQVGLRAEGSGLRAEG
jgi:hypothetical protein